MIKIKSPGMVLIAFIIAFLWSCHIEETTISATTARLYEEETIKESTIPYASKETLVKFDGDSEIISYKIARALGSLELSEKIKEEMGWHSINLSTLPVIIYGIDSRPLYYEFVVINESGREMGTVTLYARKQTSSLIKNVFPYVREYEGLITKNSAYSIFGEGYPRSLYYGIPSKAGEKPSVVIDPQTEKPAELKTAEAVEMELFNSFSDEELQKMGIPDRNAYLEEYQIKKAEAKTDAHEFWSLIESMPFDIAEELTDTKIDEIQTETKFYYSVKNTFHEIPAFNSEQMKKTVWTGYCGPSAICWIYRGFYSNYPKNSDFYLPLFGDSYLYIDQVRGYNRDGTLAQYLSNVTQTTKSQPQKGDKKGNPTDIPASMAASKIADNSLWYDGALASGTLSNNGWFGGTPTWPWGFASGFEKITEGSYTAESVFHRSSVVDAILSNNPVISWDAPDHWVVYYGVDRNYSFSFWFEWVKQGWSWVPVKRSEFKDSYKFKLHDNTAVMGTNTEYWEDNQLSLFHINLKVVKK